MYTIDSIIPIDLLFDLDIGLINLIAAEYRNGLDVFYPIIYSNNTEYFKYLMERREDTNPLIPFIIDENKKLADDLYIQFYENEYNKILQYSINTALFNLLEVSSNTDNTVRFTVWCRNVQEKHLFEDRGGKTFNLIVEKDISKLDLTPYGNVYIKNYNDILNMTNYTGKNIYIANYNYNLEECNKKMIPLPEITKQLIGTNELYVVTIHHIDMDLLPKG